MESSTTYSKTANRFEPPSDDNPFDLQMTGIRILPCILRRNVPSAGNFNVLSISLQWLSCLPCYAYYRRHTRCYLRITVVCIYRCSFAAATCSQRNHRRCRTYIWLRPHRRLVNTHLASAVLYNCSSSGAPIVAILCGTPTLDASTGPDGTRNPKHDAGVLLPVIIRNLSSVVTERRPSGRPTVWSSGFPACRRAPGWNLHGTVTISGLLVLQVAGAAHVVAYGERAPRGTSVQNHVDHRTLVSVLRPVRTAFGWKHTSLCCPLNVQ
ncbi:uncharacterized protein C8Q71DRAFT_489907 [Rhodofomes roseus]|uniref:Uncharacterized protein n=1 Tax=Rhodofomes roseus TaxID=34475 RepID=A0ABQ8KL56_9APHY|nr:uncharacterized protein C8Q71DRAFT_489907 [Rhodofomes roseus]KAH9839010.1 hypothetical protein C8Q71DRAFT_489907 [Rhodofomes roseus]